MQFVILDDAPVHHQILNKNLAVVCKKLNITCEIVLETENWREAINYASAAEPGTVWFLDIELNDTVNGIDVCKQIRGLNNEAYIIYVSAYQHYALECCQSHAFDFLLKPYTDQQLYDCLQAVCREKERLKGGYLLTVQLGTRSLQLRQQNILYFSKDGMSISAHYSNGRTFTWRESLESVKSRLRDGLFEQNHKSYIVNLAHVVEVHWSEDVLTLTNGETLPLSRRRTEAFRTAMKTRADI